MSSLVRLLLAIVLAMGCIAVTTVSFAAFALSRQVEVRDDQAGGMSLALPSALVQAGVHLIPHDVIRNALADAPELSRALPALRAACRELHEAEDGVLVAIDAPDETVRIRKADQRLVVEVHSASDDVEVSVPLATVQSLLEAVEPFVAEDGQR